MPWTFSSKFLTIAACVLVPMTALAAKSPAQQTSAKPASEIARIAPLPKGPAFTAISFANARSGWVAGPDFIWHTGNAGRAWIVQYRGPARFTGLEAVNSDVAYAWSAHALLTTKDGGKTWRTVYRAKKPIVSFSAATADTSYVVSLGSALEKTTNGGGSWRAVRSTLPLAQVDFVRPLRGWALTSSGEVYRTDDGGTTWTLSFALTPSDANGGGLVAGHITATSAKSAWALFIGGSGMSQTSYSVYHTSDGIDWRPVVNGATAGGGPGPGDAAHAPTGPLVPGGLGSSPGPLVATADNAAYMVGECSACGAGMSDIVQTTDGGRHWTSPVTIADVQGLPTLADLSFPTPTTGWLAIPGYFSDSAILVTHDRGRHWHVAWPTNPGPQNGISFVTKADGYGLGLAGDPRSVLATQDGGRTWRQIAPLPTLSSSLTAMDESGSAMEFITSTGGYALNSAGKLYRTLDRGRHWTSVAVPAMPGAILAIIAGQGCIGAPYGEEIVLWTANGGRTWHTSRHLTFSACLARHAPVWVRRPMRLHSSAENPIVAAGGTAQVAWVETANGSWTVLTDHGEVAVAFTLAPRFSDGTPLTVDYVNANDGWLEFPGGILYRTSDGGRHWLRLP